MHYCQSGHRCVTCHYHQHRSSPRLMSPFLYCLYINDCLCPSPITQYFKYSNNTVIHALLKDSNSYQSFHFTQWTTGKSLLLNVPNSSLKPAINPVPPLPLNSLRNGSELPVFGDIQDRIHVCIVHMTMHWSNVHN